MIGECVGRSKVSGNLDIEVAVTKHSVFPLNCHTHYTTLQPTRKNSEHLLLRPSRALDSFAFQIKVSSDLQFFLLVNQLLVQFRLAL